jgi:PKD repeat protein
MPNYFINASGTSVYPYATETTGAVNLTTLISGLVTEDAPLADDDVIFISSFGGPIIEADAPINLETATYIKNYRNNKTKPVWVLTNNFNFYHTGDPSAGQKTLQVFDIKFEFPSSPTNEIIFDLRCTSGGLFDSCEFYTTNSTTLKTLLDFKRSINAKVLNCIVKGKFSESVIKFGSLGGYESFTPRAVGNTIVAEGYLDGSTEVCSSPVILGQPNSGYSSIYANNIIVATQYGNVGISDIAESYAEKNDLFGFVSPLVTIENRVNITSDPKFISSSNLRLQSSSPCRNYGVIIQAGSPGDFDWYYNIDSTGYYRSDVPDIGGYAFLDTESFYVNAEGSNTAPYDTPAKGAHTLKTVLDLVSKTTIIEVVSSSSDIVEVESAQVSLKYPVTIRSWSGNATRPKIRLEAATTAGALSIAIPLELRVHTTIEGIDFVGVITGVAAGYGILISGNLKFLRNTMTTEVDEDQAITFIYLSGSLTVTNIPYGGVYSEISNSIFTGNFTTAMTLYYVPANVYNNIITVSDTFVGNTSGVYFRAAGSYAKNNIFTKCTLGIAMRNLTAAPTEQYNCFFGNTTDIGSGKAMDVTSFIQDPLFISASDFQLQENSPCIGAGIGPNFDGMVPVSSYNGVVRSGATVDIGAYEQAQTIAPVADFSADSVSGNAPLTVTFTDSSTNTPTSWAWDFGDGDTSTDQNPAHIYSTPGLYTVGLTATNDGGSDGEIKIDYIEISATNTVTSVKKPGDTKNPDDIVGMPGASDTATGSNLRDTQLGTGPGNSGNTLEKNGNKKTQNRDDQFGSSDGVRQRNNENTNGVKSFLPRIQELAQTISTFFYRIR